MSSQAITEEYKILLPENFDTKSFVGQVYSGDGQLTGFHSDFPDHIKVFARLRNLGKSSFICSQTLVFSIYKKTHLLVLESNDPITYIIENEMSQKERAQELNKIVGGVLIT